MKMLLGFFFPLMLICQEGYCTKACHSIKVGNFGCMAIDNKEDCNKSYQHYSDMTGNDQPDKDINCYWYNSGIEDSDEMCGTSDTCTPSTSASTKSSTNQLHSDRSGHSDKIPKEPHNKRKHLGNRLKGTISN